MLVNVNINDVEYEAQDNEKILSLCLKVGIFIPHICYLRDHTPSGRCGLCVVDINNGSVALSCLTTVKDGMIIKTESSTLDKIRKTNMLRILKAHTTDCFRCFKAGRCKLQRYISKTFEKSVEDTMAISNTENKDIFTKITVKMLFNRSKCINCNRCVRFLCETCGMDCKTVDVADYSSPQKDDLYGNVIDICPTAALKSNNNIWKICRDNEKNIVTHDVSSVFTPKIKITSIDNKMVDISSIGGVWIPDKIRFMQKTETDNDIDYKKIAQELPLETMDKKAFIIGESIDVETLFIIKHIKNSCPGALIVIDDSGIDPDILRKKMGIDVQDIVNIDCAIFVGVYKASEIYYIKNCIRDLKRTIMVDEISNIPDVSDSKKPYVFIAAESFKEAPDLPFVIIPKNCSQMLVKFAEDYLSLLEFEKIHNKHDIKFVCVVGESEYAPKEGIEAVNMNGKHFLSESGYYFNAFNKIIYTSLVIKSETESTREILIHLIKMLYKEEWRDVLEGIHLQMRESLTKVRNNLHSSEH